MFFAGGKDNRGFSLVELIIVVAIMAVLMVVLAPAMLRYVEKTRVQTDETAVSEVARALMIALGDDEIYSRCGGATIRVKVPDGQALVVTCGAGADPDAQPLLKKDLQTVVGESIAFTSSKYQGKTCVIDCTFNSGVLSYSIVPDVVNPGREWTVE